MLVAGKRTMGKMQKSAYRLRVWLNVGTMGWIRTPLSLKTVVWLSIGIMLAEKLALPPYLTWLVAVVWWGACSLALFWRDRRIGGTSLVILVVLTGAASFSVYWATTKTSLSRLANGDYSLSVLAQVVKITEKSRSQRELVVDVKGVFLPEGSKLARGRVMVTQTVFPEETLEPELQIGDTVAIHGRFRLPRKAGNPGQFNYRHYLYRRGISLVAYIEGNTDIGRFEGAEDDLLPPGMNTGVTDYFVCVWLWLNRQAAIWRHRLAGSWETNLPASIRGLMVAMVLGDRSFLAPGVQDAFHRTGQAHLLSVSGLHLGFVVAGVWSVVGLLPCGKVLRCGMTIIFAWLYALIAGGNPPVIRGAITMTIYLVGLAWDKGHNRLAATGHAALVQLIANPSLLFDTSFQLSHGALLGILTLTPGLQSWLLPTPSKTLIGKLRSRVVDLIIISVSAQVAIFPFLAYYFHEISWIGPILGLITVPLTGLIIPLGLFGSFLGLVSLQSSLAPLLRLLLVGLDRVTAWCATWSWSRLYVPAGSMITWIIYYMVLVFAIECLRRRQMCNRAGISVFPATRLHRKTWILLGYILALWLVYYPQVAPLWRPLEISFIDVGQGDSIFINTPYGRNILIDGGGSPPSFPENSFDMGKDIVLPFLRRRGVRRLDLVIASHFHNDHTQGLSAILREVPVTLLADNGLLDTGYASQEHRRILQDLDVNVETQRVVLRRGQYFSLDPEVELTVLYPVEHVNSKYELTQGVDQNNNSVVVKLRTRDYSVLLSGDIDRTAQMDLVGIHSLLLATEGVEEGWPSSISSKKNGIAERFGINADLLKVPHHGSREALSYSFLGAVSPAQAIISVGSNPFGHPAAEVLHALEVVTGNPPWRTDLLGSIRVRVWGSYVRIDTYSDEPPWRVGDWAVIRSLESRIRHVISRVWLG